MDLAAGRRGIEGAVGKLTKFAVGANAGGGRGQKAIAGGKKEIRQGATRVRKFRKGDGT